ncbi:uncharacterized protein RHOBADRAFT_47266 [Rhodotorula graminis WP1]|uniref:Uncharacterized protein n=1 Tax=Rhodotorula graminis (strain WP1) TaxID=578459 RepID=A0A0P9EFD1_RHOGW|nr:uncharacterized protein RHOBADRAFT_47266 [Rhodotorula graminis WP1]KPV72083.1 hypothetical protein RHOBADRAFT_47266 [Rhodotorula graminis WP1]
MRCYDLEENEPLDGQQAVTVKEHGTGRVLWTKTRELDDDEIVSTVFDSLHQPRWRIRRPTRGWYLILQRASSSPDGDDPYIELAPVKTRRGAGSDALELEFRVHGQAGSAASASSAATRPRSPSVRLDMATDLHDAPASSAMAPSLSTASAASAASSATPLNNPSSSPTAHRRSRSSMSSPVKAAGPSLAASATYRLRPSFPPGFHTSEQSRSSLFGKLKNWVVEPPRRFCCVRVAAGGGSEEDALAAEPVMAFFHPRLRGTLSLSPSLVDSSGLEPSFWAALACAYVDVIEERDGYEAAQGGD